VAALGAQADPRALGAYRMAHPAAARRERAAGAAYPVGEVGVLPERAREPLVEAADRREDAAAVRHVGRDPAAGREARGHPFPVGRAPVGGQRYLDAALYAGHLGDDIEVVAE